MPGASEAEEGLPFVGRAGQFLDELLKEVGIKQEDIYVSNTCRCRPLDNRAPTSKEAEVCIHYLLHEVSLLKPKVIVCLGKTAAQYFLPEIKSSTQMKNIVGKQFTHPAFKDITIFVTYHPAFLLRPGGQPHIAETKTHLAIARDHLIENGHIVGQALQRNYMKVSVSIKPNAPFAKFQRIT